MSDDKVDGPPEPFRPEPERWPLRTTEALVKELEVLKRVTVGRDEARIAAIEAELERRRARAFEQVSRRRRT
jgi:hypothetical protein